MSYSSDWQRFSSLVLWGAPVGLQNTKPEVYGISEFPIYTKKTGNPWERIAPFLFKVILIILKIINLSYNALGCDFKMLDGF